MESIDNAFKTNPNTPLGKAALEYGVILALVGIVAMLTMHYTGLNQQGWIANLLNWVITIVAVYWVLWNYREKKNNGFLRYGQGVGLSVLTGLFAGIIVAVFFYIFITVIAPEFMDFIVEKAITDMQTRNMSDEQIEQSMEFASFFMSPVFMSVMAVVGSVITYLITGLILSAILKRD